MTPADKRKWFAFVASLPCANCENTEVQVAHYQGFSGDKLGRGGSKRAHHLMTLPLCRECHEFTDANKASAFPEHHMRRIDSSERLLAWIAQTIIAGYEAGVLGVRK